MKSSTESLRTTPIERSSGLNPADFERIYLSGLGNPVIVTDAMDSWPARSLWSFDLFRSRYGSERVAPRMFSGPKLVKLMQLRDFLSDLDAPNQAWPGLYVEPKTKLPIPSPTLSVVLARGFRKSLPG